MMSRWDGHSYENNIGNSELFLRSVKPLKGCHSSDKKKKNSSTSQVQN